MKEAFKKFWFQWSCTAGILVLVTVAMVKGEHSLLSFCLCLAFCVAWDVAHYVEWRSEQPQYCSGGTLIAQPGMVCDHAVKVVDPCDDCDSEASS